MRPTVLLASLLLGLASPDDADRRVDEFAAKIAPGSDAAAGRLQAALRTRAGKIVLRDRTGKAAESLRRLAERDAVPDYFKARFEETAGVWRLRKGQEEYRKRLLEDYAASRADLDRLRPLVKEVADNLVEEPEINARLKRALSHPAMIEQAYHQDLRQKTRPDLYVLLKRLGEIFAMGDDGRFYIPEAKRETAQVYAKVGMGLTRTCADTAAWLKTFCESLAPFDDLHKRLKAEAGDPLFVGVLLRKSLQDLDAADPDPALQKFAAAADELKQRIPEVFENTPQGKVLLEKAAGKVQEALGTYDQARSKAAILRDPARQLASRLREGDELTATLAGIFQSDVVLALMDIDVGGEKSDLVAIVTAQIKKVVLKRDDGKYQVIPEAAEELARELKDPAQAQAKEDRYLRIISMYGEKMEDPELKAIFTARYGRYEVERAAKESLAARNPDGLASWIASHFEKTAAGYVLRPGSRDEAEGIVAEAERLEKEGGKTDLKDR
jgi:hypothetical protein